MGKRKRKLTASEKAEKARLRAMYMTIFIRGKQKRVRRPPLVEGMDPEEFMRINGDEIFFHQNEMWEYIVPREGTGNEVYGFGDDSGCSDDDLPF